MQLAVSTYSLSRWRREQGKTLEDTIDLLAEMKSPGIEFSGLDDQAKADPVGRAAELAKRCAQRGLKVVGYCVGAELLVAAADQKKVVEGLKREVDVAAALGAKSMRHDVTRGPAAGSGLTLGTVLATVVPAIRDVTEYAAAKGVKTSLENHGFYLQTADRVERLIKTVGHPNYGLTLDMGNFLCLDQDPVDAVRRLVKYAFHVHIKDFHVRPKKTVPPSGWFATPTKIALRGAIVGHGAIDIPAQLKLLKRARYAGFLSLEFEGIEDPVQGVRLGLEYLRRELA